MKDKKLEQKLKAKLIEKKAISDFEEKNPFVGIYFENLCSIVGEFLIEIIENLIKKHKNN